MSITRRQWERYADGKPMLESDLQGLVINRAEELGWAVIHIPDSRKVAKSAVGWPDLLLYRDGVIIFAELKAKGGRLTPQQQAWHKVLRDDGYEVNVWYEDDWDRGNIEYALQR